MHEINIRIKEEIMAGMHRERKKKERKGKKEGRRKGGRERKYENKR